MIMIRVKMRAADNTRFCRLKGGGKTMGGFVGPMADIAHTHRAHVKTSNAPKGAR